MATQHFIYHFNEKLVTFSCSNSLAFKIGPFQYNNLLTYNFGILCKRKHSLFYGWFIVSRIFIFKEYTAKSFSNYNLCFATLQCAFVCVKSHKLNLSKRKIPLHKHIESSKQLKKNFYFDNLSRMLFTRVATVR